MQTRFRQFNTLSEQKEQEFSNLVHKVINDLSIELDNRLKLERLVYGRKQLQRSDANRKPEDLTKELIIEPLLKFLGLDFKRSSWSIGKIRPREVDYVLEINNERILVEAEPLNSRLSGVKGQGIEQLTSYLDKKSLRAHLGIATNGFEWVLLKYDDKSYSYRRIEWTDLRPFFTRQLTKQENISDIGQNLKNFYEKFSSDTIIDAADEHALLLEENKERVTSQFYEDYIRYVFGYNKKSGKRERCLLDALKPAEGADDNNNKLFVMTLMSRLIFIKFLEDKGLAKRNLLSALLRTYGEKNVPISFYETYLKPLFYKVLNTRTETREPRVLSIPEFMDIPYLNGGLFREVVDNELEYDVDNDILELIVGILRKYTFTLEDNSTTLNPDVLGLVFEKTINYLTAGNESDRRKDLGAYYTPDDVTTFISRETIRKRVFDLVRKSLEDSGWKTSDINEYNSLEDFLDNPPQNPKTLHRVYDIISTLRVLEEEYMISYLR